MDQRRRRPLAVHRLLARREADRFPARPAASRRGLGRERPRSGAARRGGRDRARLLGGLRAVQGPAAARARTAADGAAAPAGRVQRAGPAEGLRRPAVALRERAREPLELRSPVMAETTPTPAVAPGPGIGVDPAAPPPSPEAAKTALDAM